MCVPEHSPVRQTTEALLDTNQSHPSTSVSDVNDGNVRPILRHTAATGDYALEQNSFAYRKQCLELFSWILLYLCFRIECDYIWIHSLRVLFLDEWALKAANDVRTAAKTYELRNDPLVNLKTIFRTLATLPVATIEAERLFSKMERTAANAWATMTEDRMESLLLLQTHRQLLPVAGHALDRFSRDKLRLTPVLWLEIYRICRT